MSSYSFSCYGHKNIKATHKNTLEFTKDDFVTDEGDCIIGIKADFELLKLRRFLKDKDKIRVIIKVDELEEEINCQVNPDFLSSNEIVIRKSEFKSRRTLGVRSDKACWDLSRELVEKLQEPMLQFNITII